MEKKECHTQFGKGRVSLSRVSAKLIEIMVKLTLRPGEA
jgi:hypothetical protein